MKNKLKTILYIEDITTGECVGVLDTITEAAKYFDTSYDAIRMKISRDSSIENRFKIKKIKITEGEED